MSDLTQTVSPSSDPTVANATDTATTTAPSHNVQVPMLSHILTLPLGSTIVITPKLKEQIDKALEALHFQFKVQQMLKPNTKHAVSASKPTRTAKSISTENSTPMSAATEEGKTWTPALQEQLTQLWLSNMDLQTIALRLERSCNTLITKLQKSGHISDSAMAHLARFLARHNHPLVHNQIPQWLEAAKPFGFDPQYRKPTGASEK